MAHLVVDLSPQTPYWDRKSGLTRRDWMERLRSSTCVYVGNLTFFTKEEQILELFSKVGTIKKIVMGQNAKDKTACGFSFVVYTLHEEAARAVNLLNGSILEDRNIRVDWDSGDNVDETRKFGRGLITGAQIRDEMRDTMDSDRGGQGLGKAKEIEERHVYQEKRRQYSEGMWEEPQNRNKRARSLRHPDDVDSRRHEQWQGRGGLQHPDNTDFRRPDRGRPARGAMNDRGRYRRESDKMEEDFYNN
eukprot:GHVL01025326.1.p1 GENE.GHVL01025326.1~~GHVL01025326.1.p1  ORF type:complete len:247 (+),score=39.14 GHVL01025326.1:45-785(+)